MPRADSRTAIHCTSLIRAPFAAQGPGTIVHVTLDVICARFALGGIWKRMATEISAVLIHTSKKMVFFGVQYCISSNSPSFDTKIFAIYLSGIRSGASLLLRGKV